MKLKFLLFGFFSIFAFLFFFLTNTAFVFAATAFETTCINTYGNGAWQLAPAPVSPDTIAEAANCTAGGGTVWACVPTATRYCIGGTSSTSTPTGNTATGFDYTPLEKLPGSTQAEIGTFPGYVQGIYKFGIWAVGLAALFMLTVGGFIYLSSGGNTATISKAKTYIWDALIGLVLAILAWLILFVINPDLVTVNLSSFSRVGGEVGSIAPITSTTPTVATQTANETLTRATAYAKNPGSTWYPDAAQDTAVAQLNAYKVLINGVAGTSKLCRTEGQAASCTSLYNFPSGAVSVLQQLGEDCRVHNGGSWCTISMTGGTEYWKHSRGTTHVPGNPVLDIGKNTSSQSFLKYLQSVSPEPTCTRRNSKGEERAVYTIPVTGNFGTKYLYLWDEDPNHWHGNVDYNMCT